MGWLRTHRSLRSIAKASVDSIEFSQQRGPFHDAIRPSRLGLIVAPRVLEYRLRDIDQLGVASHRSQLRTARQLKAMRPVERFADRAARDESAMIAQNQRFAASEISDQ